MVSKTHNPPPRSVLEAFHIEQEKPVRFEGGQGTTWGAGKIILKPECSAEWANYAASAFDALPEHEEFRFARPVKSKSGKWMEDGWTAYTFLEGEHVTGHYKEKLLACDAFHKAVAHLTCPSFLNAGKDPWSIADRVAWQEETISFHPAMRGIVSEIFSLMEPLSLPAQAMHGDMIGNFLFAEGKAPGIIDFSPYWRPSGLAQGFIIADAISWENAGSEVLTLVDTPYLGQLILRAALRRIAEQQEHMNQKNSPFHKDIEGALPLVKGYETVVRLLKESTLLVSTSGIR